MQNRDRGVVLLSSLLALVTACRGDACRSPDVLRYETPGCGALPVCGSPQQDGCLSYFCGCDGRVIGGCDYTRQPYSRRISALGAVKEGDLCSTEDGGPATPADAPVDNPAAPPDAPTTDRSTADGTTSDGQACQAPSVWRYVAVGCGAEAHPVCGPRAQDGCARAYCGCDGKLVFGCDYASRPYSHAVSFSSGQDGDPCPRDDSGPRTDGPTSDGPS